MKITMDGKYAFEDNPTEKVRIICVDAGNALTVVGLRPSGSTFRRKSDGTPLGGAPSLIPLQRKPLEFWVNVYSNGHININHTKDMALGRCIDDGETILVREVLD